jgi:hypothetical protein
MGEWERRRKIISESTLKDKAYVTEQERRVFQIGGEKEYNGCGHQPIQQKKPRGALGLSALVYIRWCVAP